MCIFDSALKIKHLDQLNLFNLKSIKSILHYFRFLTNNNLNVIKNGVFDGLHRLIWLFLCNNNIKKLEMKSIRNLKSLQWM